VKSVFIDVSHPCRHHLNRSVTRVLLLGEEAQKLRTYMLREPRTRSINSHNGGDSRSPDGYGGLAQVEDSDRNDLQSVLHLYN
jgi:hypothetical protein